MVLFPAGLTLLSSLHSPNLEEFPSLELETLTLSNIECCTGSPVEYTPVRSSPATWSVCSHFGGEAETQVPLDSATQPFPWNYPRTEHHRLGLQERSRTNSSGGFSRRKSSKTTHRPWKPWLYPAAPCHVVLNHGPSFGQQGEPSPQPSQLSLDFYSL